MTHGIKENI